MKAPALISCSAPGKLILSGEHAVVYGHPALATSISLKTTVEIRAPQFPTAIRISLPGVEKPVQLNGGQLRRGLAARLGENPTAVFPDGKLDFLALREKLTDDLGMNTTKASEKKTKASSTPLSGLPAMYRDTLDVIKLLFWVLTPPRNFDMNVTTELPLSRGMGSSASFSNACCGAFLAMLTPEQVEEFVRWLGPAPEPKLQTPLTPVQTVAWHLAYQCERIFHGTPSGLDNLVTLVGGGVLFRNRKDYELVAIPPVNVLIVDTNVPGATKQVVAEVREARERWPKLYDAIFTAIGEATNATAQVLDPSKLKAAAEDSKELPPASGTVQPSQETFDRLSELFRVNQGLLLALGAGHPAAVTAQAIAERHGLELKISGGGGGGILIGLGSNPPERFVAELKAAGLSLLQTQTPGPNATSGMVAQIQDPAGAASGSCSVM